MLNKQSLIRMGDRLLDLSVPRIMGIINVTPDSFYDGGMYETREMVKLKAGRMLADGAAILDIGACSTRPGSIETDAETEKRRLETALAVIRDEFPDAFVSVDTYRSSIAEWAIGEYGVQMINDVSGGNLDPDMFDTIGRLKPAYVMMHMLGTPRIMQENPVYEDIIGDISRFFYTRIRVLRDLGADDILIDPGFGFGKTISQNYELLSRLREFDIFELPLVVGVSRKSMIYNVLKNSPEAALNGTTVLHTIALMKGANIIRAHDVRQAAECIELVRRANDHKGTGTGMDMGTGTASRAPSTDNHLL